MSFIYHGSSMLRVFAPGDEIILAEVDFAALEVGDVVCFRSASGGLVIHRVIGREADRLFTMGDNNTTPDHEPVKADQEVRLAFALIRGGRRFPVAVGRAGVRQFCCNRLRYWCRRWLRRLLLPAVMTIGRCLGRKRLECASYADGSKCYFAGKVPVARQNASGEVHYIKWYYRFFYHVDSVGTNRSRD